LLDIFLQEDSIRKIYVFLAQKVPLPHRTGTFSRFRFVPALLVLALALLFSGCNDNQRLFGELYGVDGSPDGNGAGEGGSGLAGGGGGGGNAEPGNVPNGYAATGKTVANAIDLPDIKNKFSGSENQPGKAGVGAAFKELSAFIRNGGLEKDEGEDGLECVIQLGDYIDLEGGVEAG
jgi:hypothetical protein